MLSKLVGKWKSLNESGVKPAKIQIGSLVKQIHLENIGMYKPIKRADDRYFVFNRSRKFTRFSHWIVMTFGIVSSFAIFVYAIYSGSRILVIAMWLCTAILFIVLSHILPPRAYKFTFDRLAGTLTIEIKSLTIRVKKDTVVKPFESVEFLIDWEGFDKEGDRDFPALLIADVNGRVAGIHRYKPLEWVSFYVWFMDRNRPLPPGTAFDFYRESDYERRKFPRTALPINYKNTRMGWWRRW